MCYSGCVWAWHGELGRTAAGMRQQAGTARPGQGAWQRYVDSGVPSQPLQGSSDCHQPQTVWCGGPGQAYLGGASDRIGVLCPLQYCTTLPSAAVGVHQPQAATLGASCISLAMLQNVQKMYHPAIPTKSHLATRISIRIFLIQPLP